MPTITTVIPSYRRPTLLKRAIESVLAQDYRDLEVCVYDDASGDETSKVATKIAQRDSRVKYFCNEQNIGLVANFAQGVARVRTPFFNLLSDDDYLAPGFFNEGLRALRRRPSARLFIGCLSLVHNESVIGMPVHAWREGIYDPNDTLAKLTDHRQSLTWTSMIFDSRVLQTVGGVDTETGYVIDIDFELRVATRYPAVVSTKPCAFFTAHPGAHLGDYFLSLLEGLPRILTSVDRECGDAHAAGDLDWRGVAKRRQTVRRGFRDWVFRWSVAATCSGLTGQAPIAAQVLEDVLGAPRRAEIVRTIADESAKGAIAREGYRWLRWARTVARGTCNRHRHR